MYTLEVGGMDSKTTNLHIITCKLMQQVTDILYILNKYNHKPDNSGTIYGHQLLRKQKRDHGKAWPFCGPLVFQISEEEKEIYQQ